MNFTGERLVPDIPHLENMIIEELGRLNFAQTHFQHIPALDFGCGTGHGANFMAENGASIAVGVDLAQDAIQFAGQHYRHDKLYYSQMNCLQTALTSESFGFICSLDVIEHFKLADIQIFLAEIWRLLIPGGYCLITTPNKYHTSPRSRPSWPFHLHEFFYDDLQQTLQQVFESVEIYGSRVPIYENRKIRQITNSGLSRIKHYLPAKIRVGFSSGLRYMMKQNLQLEDVKIVSQNVEQARVFVALCRKN